MRTPICIALICTLGLAGALSASAGDKHGKHGRDQRSEDSDNRGDEYRGQAGRTFSDEERQTVYGYVDRFGKQEGKHPRSLPPGLAKKAARGGRLPPGWEAKCVRGETMPVEVYEEARPLPKELTVKLPVPPVGTVTVAVGGKVVRLLEATREILDVFDVHVRF